MSSPTPSVSLVQTSSQPTNFSHSYIVQRALSKGRKASHDFKDNFRSPNCSQRLITAGRHVEGVFQDFVIHGTSATTIVIPYAFTKNVKKKDFYLLLDAQRTEHLLVDVIASSPVSHISNRYYSQVLMAQRLQRAELEVELYRLAIARDGLCLLEDNEGEDEEDDIEPE